MAARPNIGGALCESSVFHSLYYAAKFGSRPLLECRAVTLPIEENARLGRTVNIARSKIPSWGKSPRKCIHSVPVQETAKRPKHRAKFGWPPVSDVAAVMKARRETRRNLLGCPKLPNRSQPLVGRSSPYTVKTCHMCRRHCRSTSFSHCRYMPSLRRYSPTEYCAMVPRWRFLAIFASCIFQRAACSRFQTCICTKATSCVEVW